MVNVTIIPNSIEEAFEVYADSKYIKFINKHKKNKKIHLKDITGLAIIIADSYLNKDKDKKLNYEDYVNYVGLAKLYIKTRLKQDHIEIKENNKIKKTYSKID